MFTQRATAYKTMVRNVLSSEYVAKEGEGAHIILNGKQASRVRLLATIVNKFTNDEKKSGTLIIDDGTEVMSVRGWEGEYDTICKASVGALVDIVGRVRKYNDDIYVIPEVIKPVEPDWLVLRKLELGRKTGDAPEITEENAEVKDGEEQKKLSDNTALKNDIIELIKKKGTEGATIEELTELAGDRNKCVECMRSLIEDDMIFEPRAGRYKLL